MIEWVCFDVGETLFDERGLWARWADWIGVSRQEFIAELSLLIREGKHHREVFQRFAPGLDINEASSARLAAGDPPGFLVEDLFPDVRPCLASLARSGIGIGIAGNNTARTEAIVAAAGLGQDFVASSSKWGVEKPEPAFFEHLIAACGTAPDRIAYVGDRLDNDALPASASGMHGIWLRRGLWANEQRAWPQARDYPFAIDRLVELEPLIQRLAVPGRG